MSLFCLVHGSGHGPNCWDLLAPQLEKLGHQTICADLPVDEPDASATRYAQVIAASLTAAGAPAIVVAHSASGMFLPLVPGYCDVSRMVFLAALVPEPGKSVRQRFKDDPEMFNPEWVGQNPTIDPAVARRFLFHDCTEDVSRWALTTLRLMYARAAIEEPCPLQSWPMVPSTYILPTEDRTINPRWWKKEATRLLQVQPLEIPGGHCPYFSRPQDLALLLFRLAG